MQSADAAKARFLSHVDTGKGCWLWMGARLNAGYGICELFGKTTTTHRAAWMLFKGEIPAAKHVLHRCDVRNCVNPEHLFLGTNLDNMQDKVNKGRHVAGRIFGEQNPHSSLNADTVAEIHRLAEKLRQKEIANIIGCHPATISRIVRGERRAQG